MKKEIKQIIQIYQKGNISKDEFKVEINKQLNDFHHDIEKIFLEIANTKNSDEVEDLLTILWAFDNPKEEIEILNKLLIAPWHKRHEDIIHAIQQIKNPESIPFIKKAIQQKFQYLIDYGTGERQFINQSGHALASIGTQEALDVIYELSKSTDFVLKDEMLYRISKITGKNNHPKNYNLDV